MEKRNKKVEWAIYLFSGIVFLLVASLHKLPKPDFRPDFTFQQPFIHACLNATVFVLLLVSLFAIMNKNVNLHKRLNSLAMLASLIFLLSYVVYHYFSPETSYAGNYRGMYLFILITHIALAAFSLPFILLAYYHGFNGNVTRHRKMVKFVYPVWLYVALTGVIVYVLLSPYYAS